MPWSRGFVTPGSIPTHGTALSFSGAAKIASAQGEMRPAFPSSPKPYTVLLRKVELLAGGDIKSFVPGVDIPHDAVHAIGCGRMGAILHDVADRALWSQIAPSLAPREKVPLIVRKAVSNPFLRVRGDHLDRDGKRGRRARRRSDPRYSPRESSFRSGEVPGMERTLPTVPQALGFAL